MNKLVTKIGVGIIGGALATLVSMAPALAADNNTLRCEIKDNGRDSSNTCTITLREVRRGRRARPPQNEARIDNTVRLDISTGHNEVNDSRGDNISVKSGNVDLTVTIDNTVNF